MITGNLPMPLPVKRELLSTGRGRQSGIGKVKPICRDIKRATSKVFCPGKSSSSWIASSTAKQVFSYSPVRTFKAKKKKAAFSQILKHDFYLT